MNVTKTKPSVSLEDFKRTKILATIGPATASYDQIKKLIKAGANGLRLNFSHGTYEQMMEWVGLIRQASQELNKPVAILADTAGPKVRLGDFEGLIPVESGQEIKLGFKADYEASGVIPTQYDLSQKVKKGETVLLYDGRIKAVVRKVLAGIVYLEAQNDGVLVKRKGINLPDTDFAGDVITAKDRKDLAFISTLDVDYVAQSFIQTAKDVLEFKKVIKNLGIDAKYVSKIETNIAVRPENLEEIIKLSDVVMVARGDLAAEVPPETLPVLQRDIVDMAHKHCKLSIIATQMLLSMTDSPEPTRAEVSDVASAVFMGSDTVMLSEETAAGKYPVAAVQMMKRIIMSTQNSDRVNVTETRSSDSLPVGAIAKSTINLAEALSARAIVAETRSGKTALEVSSRHPKVPVVMVTPSPRVAQQLALSYSGMAFVRPNSRIAAQKLTDWLRSQHIFKSGDLVVMVMGKYPGVVGSTDTIKVRILE